jgi:uncharacterized protein YqeY
LAFGNTYKASNIYWPVVLRITRPYYVRSSSRTLYNSSLSRLYGKHIMSDLKLRLANAVKDAMRAKASERLGTLRFLQAAIKQREIDERKDLNDADVVAIIEKQVKQRRESIAAFEQAGRTETAAQETAEMAVLKEFLPQAASEADIAAAIDAAVAEVHAQGVTGAPAMGKVMAILKQALAGRAEMSALSARVKAKLS